MTQFFLVIHTVRDSDENNFKKFRKSGDGQNLKLLNVEQAIFRNFQISNIKITKVELFDFFIFEFISYFYVCLNYSNTRNTYMILYQSGNF